MRTFLFILLFLWLLVFLRLALWPFDFSRSNLATFVPGKGLRFSVPSVAITDGVPSKITGLDSIALVLSFYPDRNGATGCIVEYAPPWTPTNLRIQQTGRIVDFAFRIPDGRLKHIFIPISNMDSLQTFVCDVREYTVFVFHSNRLAKREDMWVRIMSAWDPEAKLMFGCTASGKFRWQGTLERFEIHRSIDVDSSPHLGALLLSYDLTEHQSRLIPDGGPEPKVPLAVPEQVIAPGRKILSTPFTYWDGRWNRGDLANNVIAFIPLGFLIALLFEKRFKRFYILLLALGIAGLISLSVEIFQFFVPYRDSSIVDVVTNTSGSFCGALFVIAVRSLPFLRPR